LYGRKIYIEAKLLEVKYTDASILKGWAYEEQRDIGNNRY